MAKMDWEKAKRSGPPRGRGISNAQARFLARLQRQLGVPYTGNGLTSVEASRAIAAARAELARISDGQRAWRAIAGSTPPASRGRATMRGW